MAGPSIALADICAIVCFQYLGFHGDAWGHYPTTAGVLQTTGLV